eukprot:8024724-Alexandrium_andersonii.AAC.1
MHASGSMGGDKLIEGARSLGKANPRGRHYSVEAAENFFDEGVGDLGEGADDEDEEEPGIW